MAQFDILRFAVIAIFIGFSAYAITHPDIFE